MQAQLEANSLKLLTFLKIMLIAISLFSCKDSLRKPKTDLEKMRLFGKVKKLTELKYSEGQINLENQDRNSKLELLTKEITKFNPDGNIEETQTIYYYYPDSLSYLNKNKTIFIYDKDGFLLKFYNTSDSLREKRFEYDKHGNLIKVQWFLNSTPLGEKYEYQYDRNSHLIEEKHWDTSATPVMKKTHFYDQNGYKRETTVYKRNKNGQLLFDSKSNSTYDSTGTLNESSSLYRNDLATKSSFIHDSYGNTTLIIRYNSQGVITERDSSFYEYDHNKNWIKKNNYSVTLSFIQPLLLEINQRIIDYY